MKIYPRLLHYCKMLGFLTNKTSAVPQYSLVEDRERLLAEESQPLELPLGLPRRPWLQWTAILFHLILFCIAASLGAFVGLRWLRNPDGYCTRHTSQYCKSTSKLVDALS